METKMVMIISSFPSKETAKEVAGKLVKNKLAACVQITSPVTSIYEWEGKINEDEEVLLFIKTSSASKERTIEFIKKDHPYDVPEIIVLPVVGGFDKYIEWVESITAYEI